MSGSILGHARFEELCAMASVGQISPREYEELSAHLRECGSCRESYTDFVKLTHEQLPLLAAESIAAPKEAGVFAHVFGTDHKGRFTARARERGIEISGSGGARRGHPAQWVGLLVPRSSYAYASAALIVTLMGVMAVLSHRWKEESARNVALARQLVEMSERNAALQGQVQDLSHGKQTVETNLVKTEMDLAKTRTDTSDQISRVRDLEQQVTADRSTIADLTAQRNAANDHGADTEQKLRDAQQSLVAVNQEFTKLRASRGDEDADVTARRIEFADLSRRVKDQEELIEKQQKLLAVDEDVRNLMAARSLHITDVFDVDGKGRRKSAFGRVFYTEGRSLIFYAFDLDAPRITNAKHSFQAWGQLSDSGTSAVSLGIFYVDDPAQKRWMLRFDNPDVLKRLNAVFVTSEPHGGTARPTGQKLMYAYLGHEPNHP